MDPAKRILISLVSISQRIQATTARYANAKDARQVQGHSLIRLEMELQAIAAACRAILEILKDPCRSRQWMLDDRLIDWLSGTEPKTCLETLNEMQDLLKVGHGVQMFNSREFACPEDEAIVAVVTFFHSRKIQFHFLLTGDIWNYDTGPPKRNPSMDVDSDNLAGEITQNHPRPSIGMDCVVSRDESRRKREAVSQKLDKFLKFLDALDCAAKQKETLSLRQVDTCTWLCLTREYKSWRGGYESFLLLQGKAGAGKTVLVSTVIEELLETKHEDEFLAYFYCDFRSWRSTGAVDVMRSILAQLVSLFCAVAVEPEDLLNDLLKETSNSVDLFFSVRGLSRCLSKVAKLCPRKPLIVIDALDECKEMEALIDGLIAMDGDVRTFVTSRPLQNIIAVLSRFPTILMDGMANELSADILLHVTKELDSRRRLRTFEESLKGEIKSKLCAKAYGMFRWVQCQIDTLDKCTSVSEVRRVLESLPEGLEETYRRILIAIDRQPDDARRVRRALVWLVTALRPMRMDELLEAIMINPSYRALDSRFKLMSGADLLEVCRCLVVHHGETDVITLSHMSVKEYLVGELVRMKLPLYHIVVEDAHKRLAKLCMAYIAFRIEEMEEPRDQRSNVTHVQRIILTTTPQGSRPLLKYVLSHGFTHLSYLGPDKAGIFNDLKGLQSVIHRHPREWNQLCKLVPSVRSGTPWPTSQHDFTLYILVAFASDALFRTYLSGTTLIPREGANPLVYAAYLGKTEHARILISQGVDLNLGGLIVDAMVTHSSYEDIMDVGQFDEDDSDSDISDADDDSDCKTTPLEASVDHWHAEFVDLLLAEGCIVPDRLFTRVLGKRSCDFPLYILNRLLHTSAFAKWTLSPWENRGLLEVLVESAEDPEDHGEHSRDEVALALRRLAEVGCAEALLLLAVEKGCISVVDTLLSMSAPSSVSRTRAVTNALSPNGDTPLHLAMRLSDEKQCLIVTKLLVEAGSSPCERDANDKPPVHVAVARGFISVVEYLLSQGVSLPARILFAALQVTLLKRVDMIRFLISKGALVRVHNSDGNTLLHVVMRSLDRSVCLEIAEMLIDAGCNPSDRNLRGETPLQIAARQGYYEVANYLLLFCTSSGVLSLLHSDSKASTQASVLRPLIGDPDGLRLGPEDEDKTFQAVRQFLDNQEECLELAKCFVGAADNLFSHSLGSATLFDIAVIRGFTRVVEYLVSVAVPLPSGILFTALQHQPEMIHFLASKGADLHARDDNGDTLLHVAVSTAQEAYCCRTVKSLVEVGCPTSMVNAAGVRPIQIAVSQGFTDVVDYLLSRPLHAVTPPDLLLTALQLRCPSSMVRLLLAHGVSVSCHASDGDHLLHVVLKSMSDEDECLKIVLMLVEAGCSCTVPDAAGRMPLHIVITRRFTSVVDYLLSRDVPLPPDILTHILDSQASFYGRYDWVPVFTSLIQKGANLHARDADGNTLVHLAMRPYAESMCLGAIKVLVNAGCGPSIPNSEGELPVQLAVARGMAAVVEYLLSQRASFPPGILLTALKGRTAFHWEVLSMVSSLVRCGADVNALASNGDTTLHVALAHEKNWLMNKYSCLLDVVRILVENGCDIRATDAAGHTPFDVAEANQYFEVAKYLSLLSPPIPGGLATAHTPPSPPVLPSIGHNSRSTSPTPPSPLVLPSVGYNSLSTSPSLLLPQHNNNLLTRIRLAISKFLFPSRT